MSSHPEQPHDPVTELRTLIKNLKVSYSLLGSESLDAPRHDAHFARGLEAITLYVKSVANQDPTLLEGPFEAALCDLVTFISDNKPKGFRSKLDKFQDFLFDLSTSNSLNQLSSSLQQTLNPRRHNPFYKIFTPLRLIGKKKIE